MTDKLNVTQADRAMADKAFDIAFGGDPEYVDRDMAELFARHRMATDTQVSKLVSALERIAQIDSDGLESHTPQAMVSIARIALADVDSDPPCTDCNDTGYNPNTERQCTCDAALTDMESKHD